MTLIVSDSSILRKMLVKASMRKMSIFANTVQPYMRKHLTKPDTQPHNTAALKAQALLLFDQQPPGWLQYRPVAVALGRHLATLYRWYQHDPVFRASVDAISEQHHQIWRTTVYASQERERQRQRDISNLRWLTLRQAQAAHARSCRRCARR